MSLFRQKAGKSRLVILFFLFLFLFAARAESADKIFLKDGKVYEGRLKAQSDKRYLFSIGEGEEATDISFFVEDVDKVELDKQTVKRQIPFLKEVESLKVEGDKKGEGYELSLYKKGQLEGNRDFFTAEEIRGILNDEEFAYYSNFTGATSRHADELVLIDNICQNLPQATHEDFVSAKKTLDQLYFEVNAVPAPPIFKESHQAYLDFIKSSFTVFGALERGLLDEASRQMSISEQSKRKALLSFRQAILQRKQEKMPEHPAANDAALTAPGRDRSAGQEKKAEP